MIDFNLDEEQKARFKAWSEHHWETVHPGWSPPDHSGFTYQFIFGPTMSGMNIKVKCVWCKPDNPKNEVVLTEGDDGDFIYQYDENWNRLKADWE